MYRGPAVLVVLPQDPRQARVANHLNEGDLFWPLRQWPTYLQTLALSPHRNNRERFTLFSFLTGNGLDPTTAGQWTLMDDYRNGWYNTRGYDDSAHRQVDQMKNAVRNRTFFKGDKRMMDMAIGKVVNQ